MQLYQAIKRNFFLLVYQNYFHNLYIKALEI